MLNTLHESDPDLEPGAGADTLVYRLQLRFRPKVLAPCGSGSTTLTSKKTVPGVGFISAPIFRPQIRETVQKHVPRGGESASLRTPRVLQRVRKYSSPYFSTS
jgi:hypothetical protein